MDPDQIYEFYTKMGIEKLHEELCQAAIRIPDTAMYVVIHGEMNSLIELRQLGRDGSGVALYTLQAMWDDNNIPSYSYKQPTRIHPLELGYVFDFREFSPREAFIRSFILWTGGNMEAFDDVIRMIRTGDTKNAIAVYAGMMNISSQEASIAIDHLVDEMKASEKTKKVVKK